MFPGKAAFKKEFKRTISSQFGKSLEDSSVEDQCSALSALVRNELTERWVNTNKAYQSRDTRQIYYFSLEFLMGQCLESHLIYLGGRDICEEGLRELGLDLNGILAAEPDAGLGNGGLGRLAACFLDSMASLGLPGHGCGIRYRHGLFTQQILDGYQVELADGWLREKNDWEIRKPDKAVLVEFNGHVASEIGEDGEYHFRIVDAQRIRAVPHDIPIPGYKNNTVNTLRLWKAESVGDEFNFASFSRGDYIGARLNSYLAESISEVLYPDDSNYQNRILRLKQQYFLCSAGLQSIVRRYLKGGKRELKNFADKVCIQINDTHPALAVPELMRLLMDVGGLGWDESWSIVTRTIAYTNHTILPEALEKWPVDAVRELLPRIYMIIEEINRRFCADLMEVYPDTPARWGRMAIIGDGVVRMAHLAIVGSFSVNGVAAVHSELLKNVVLKDFYEFSPRKFNNKTNGITHRRWLIKSNPELTSFITEAIGPSWISDPLRLTGLESLRDDAATLQKLGEIKHRNKEKLAAFIKERNGITVDPSAIFDVQVKRIHGYKRQLLNLLHILHLYNNILEGKEIGAPRVFIMAGKAAPSYYFAKNVIKLANEMSAVIDGEPRCKGKLSLVFLANYGISIAERIFPGSEISEQISTASKEASGTSNMKFMMNGALTLGTADGANIEIFDYVGEENGFLFGLTVDEVLHYYSSGDYNPHQILAADPRLQKCTELLKGKLNPKLPHDEFINILCSLYDYGDEFFVLRDFDAYVEAQETVSETYADRKRWNLMSLYNIARSGVFASDSTIRQYANEIWKIEPFR
ncbi:MAG: glycogen/starch/alpha-glucan phosphorylase [Oscillospiraceae bacterium]|jgi:starch phosphorylase|nr:glycogen/starch/alpha-glucan phosphorylase [Oscillospiraceae bacterium]